MSRRPLRAIPELPPESSERLFRAVFGICLRWGLVIGAACGAATGVVVGLQDGLDGGSWGFGLIAPGAVVGGLVGVPIAVGPSVIGGSWVAGSLTSDRRPMTDPHLRASRLLRRVVLTLDVLIVVPLAVGVVLVGGAESRLVSLAAVVVCNIVALSLISRPASVIARRFARPERF